MAGLTTDGFQVKTLTEIDEELDAKLKQVFGENADTSPNEPLGQLKGIWAEREADLWDLGLVNYRQGDPDSAVDGSLNSIAALTGTTRDSAQPSTVTAVATGTNGTVLTAGRQASVVSTGTKFQTIADATIATATAWAPATAYTVGQRRRNGSTQRIYECITAGTSAGSGGPTTTAADIVDGSVHWAYLGDGAGFVDVAMESVETGPKIAAARTLTVIETAVGGWSGVINTLDAVLGSDEESNTSLRQKREDELRNAGRSALDAIRSNLLRVADVTACSVFENYTMLTDADGLPPKSIECLVQGGTNQDVFDAVLANKPAGIETYGTTIGSALDVEGGSHTIKFSRPTDIPIYVVLNIVGVLTDLPADASDQLKEAIAEYGQTVKAAKDVVASKLESVCFAAAIAAGWGDALLDVTALIGTAPAPGTSVTISITRRQLADYDTSRVTVNTSGGTP